MRLAYASGLRIAAGFMAGTASVLLLAGSARAQPTPAFQPVQAPQHDPLECYCLAQGRKFAEGQSVCLRMPEGARMAECRMVINVMSWAVTEHSCPES